MGIGAVSGGKTFVTGTLDAVHLAIGTGFVHILVNTALVVLAYTGRQFGYKNTPLGIVIYADGRRRVIANQRGAADTLSITVTFIINRTNIAIITINRGIGFAVVLAFTGHTFGLVGSKTDRWIYALGIVGTFQILFLKNADPVFTFLRAGTLVTVYTDLAANLVTTG